MTSHQVIYDTCCMIVNIIMYWSKLYSVSQSRSWASCVMFEIIYYVCFAIHVKHLVV